jgi:hypothetical protein
MVFDLCIHLLYEVVRDPCLVFNICNSFEIDRRVFALFRLSQKYLSLSSGTVDYLLGVLGTMRRH